MREGEGNAALARAHGRLGQRPVHDVALRVAAAHAPQLEMHRQQTFEGAAIGAIQLRCLEVQPFSDQQIALLEAFADQAVIAIENARLFEELERRNRELSEALEQQTVTAEVLRVIASSPTDLDGVLNAIVQSTAALCEAGDVVIWRTDGDLLRLVATFGTVPRQALGEHLPAVLWTELDGLRARLGL